MSEFSELKRKLDYLSAEQVAQVEQAYQVAHKAHEDQTRSSGEPYITHPLAVAMILADFHLDAESITAAILHDVIEDTHVDKDTLTADFGEEVAELVDGVSKLTQIQFQTRAEAQAANFRKMMMAMSKDIRIILIKLADRLHNMRTLGHLSTKKRSRIAKETLEIYAPIANRLGMRAFRDELQELGFHALYPYRYKILMDAVKKARGNRKEILGVIYDSLNQSLVDAGVREFTLVGREKYLYSIYRKMKNKHLKFAEIMDVYAFRIVVEDVDTCYRVLGAVHNSYKPVPERFKDYVAIPKVNGYQSLHTTLFGPYGVPIEIQIRTRDMEQMSESGIAAHWLYKAKENIVNQAQLRAREWIKGVLEIQKSTGSSIEFIENVKIDLFPDEVYVFTPQGEIMELPNGATAVDFAYAVHSDVGNCCVAVKINRRLLPLSTKLKSGQTIEIITASGAHPNPAWLNFVRTGKSRSNIRHFLKQQQHGESVDLGQRLLDAALARSGLQLSDISDQQIQSVLALVGLKTRDDLLEAIGLGDQVAPVIARRLSQEGPAEEQVLSVQEEAVLAIKGTEGMAVNFGKCCYPLPGDPIFGVLSAGHGVIVHAEQCRNTVDFRRKHSDQCFAMRWEEDVHGEFQVGIAIGMENHRGALAKLAVAISEAEGNLEDIIVKEVDARYVTFHMLLSVLSRTHLAQIIRRIRQLRGVTKVTRHRQQIFKHKV